MRWWIAQAWVEHAWSRTTAYTYLWPNTPSAAMLPDRSPAVEKQSRNRSVVRWRTPHKTLMARQKHRFVSMGMWRNLAMLSWHDRLCEAIFLVAYEIARQVHH